MTHLVDGMQEEERERRMDFVPDESAVNTEHIEVRPVREHYRLCADTPYDVSLYEWLVLHLQLQETPTYRHCLPLLSRVGAGRPPWELRITGVHSFRESYGKHRLQISGNPAVCCFSYRRSSTDRSASSV